MDWWKLLGLEMDSSHWTGGTCWAWRWLGVTELGGVLVVAPGPGDG